MAGGQRPEGFISEKTPVWTPSASMPGRSESGSSMRWASARINSSLKGGPGLTVAIEAWSRFRAEQRIASASDCSSCDRGCSGLLWLMCARTLCERLDFCAQFSQAWEALLIPESRGRLWSAELGAPAPSQMGGRCATNGPKVLRRDAYESSVRFPRLRGSLLTRPKLPKPGVPSRVAYHRLHRWCLGASVLSRRLRLCRSSSFWVGGPPSSKRGVAPHGICPRFQVNFFTDRERLLEAHTSCFGRSRSRWLGGRTRCARCGP